MDTKTKKYCGKKIAETLKNILHQLNLGGKQNSKKIIDDKQVRLYIFYVYIIFYILLFVLAKFPWAFLPLPRHFTFDLRKIPWSQDCNLTWEIILTFKRSHCSGKSLQVKWKIILFELKEVFR